jgi:hypothetical protein
MSILTVIPTKYRKYAYAVLALAALVLAAYKASDGDWLLMSTYILGALGFGTATANTHPVETEHDDTLRV